MKSMDLKLNKLSFKDALFPAVDTKIEAIVKGIDEEAFEVTFEKSIEVTKTDALLNTTVKIYSLLKAALGLKENVLQIKDPNNKKAEITMIFKADDDHKITYKKNSKKYFAVFQEDKLEIAFLLNTKVKVTNFRAADLVNAIADLQVKAKVKDIFDYTGSDSSDPQYIYKQRLMKIIQEFASGVSSSVKFTATFRK